ncbi:MAG: hypothetical protein NTY02_15300 [Acidobacteria bacterium]|nr:hypothetical protein [Acidobacteriota bacterium]
MLKILGAQGITQNVADEIETLSATVTDPNDKQQLDEALAQLSAALDPALWRSPLDQLQLDPTNGDKVFQAFADATKTLLKLIDDPTSTIPDAPLQALVDRIVAADRMLAVTAISAAGGGVTTMAATAAVSDATMAAAASPIHRVDKKIEEAMKELEKGDAEALAGKPRKAIDHYGKAWKKAQEAIKKS